MVSRLIVLFLLFTSLSHSFGQEKMSLEASLQGGILVPHRPQMKYLVQGKSFGADLKLNITEHHGLALHWMYSGNPETIGWCSSIYGFTKKKFGKTKTDNFLIGMGAGFVSKPYEANSNSQNIATGSHLNIFINLGYHKWISERLSIGLDATHYSNGSFQSPNLGLNFLSFKTAYKFRCNRDLKNIALETDSTRFQINFGIGIHQNKVPNSTKFVLASFNPTYKLPFEKGNFYVGSDLYYNPAITELVPYKISSFQIGTHLTKRFDLKGLFFDLALGGYWFNQNPLQGFFYHKLAIQKDLGSHLLLGIELKSHWAIAETIQLKTSFQF